MDILAAQKEYIKDPNGRCPACKSLRTKCDDHDYDAFEYQEFHECTDCGASWVVVYVLARISDLEIPEKEET